MGKPPLLNLRFSRSPLGFSRSVVLLTVLLLTFLPVAGALAIEMTSLYTAQVPLDPEATTRVLQPMRLPWPKSCCGSRAPGSATIGNCRGFCSRTRLPTSCNFGRVQTKRCGYRSTVKRSRRFCARTARWCGAATGPSHWYGWLSTGGRANARSSAPTIPTERRRSTDDRSQSPAAAARARYSPSAAACRSRFRCWIPKTCQGDVSAISGAVSIELVLDASRRYEAHSV